MKMFCLMIIVILLNSCKKEKDVYDEVKPADSMMTPAPAPAPAPMPISYSEKPPENSEAVTAIMKSENTWDSIRTSEDKYVGKTVHFERLEILTVYSDNILAHTAGLKYVVVKYPNGRLHEDDWVDVTGVFQGVNTSGELVIDCKKIKNLGIHPPD